jgi:hypothetical protein
LVQIRIRARYYRSTIRSAQNIVNVHKLLHSSLLRAGHSTHKRFVFVERNAPPLSQVKQLWHIKRMGVHLSIVDA